MGPFGEKLFSCEIYEISVENPKSSRREREKLTVERRIIYRFDYFCFLRFFYPFLLPFLSFLDLFFLYWLFLDSFNRQFLLLLRYIFL